jgi:hypothetical protein
MFLQHDEKSSRRRELFRNANCSPVKTVKTVKNGPETAGKRSENRDKRWMRSRTEKAGFLRNRLMRAAELSMPEIEPPAKFSIEVSWVSGVWCLVRVGE